VLCFILKRENLFIFFLLQEIRFVIYERFIFVDFRFDFLTAIELVEAGCNCFFGGAYILLLGLFYLVNVGAGPDFGKTEVLFECHPPIIQTVGFVNLFLG